MNKEQIKKLLKENIEFLESLTTEEYTLYRSWSHANTDEMKKWFKENRSEIATVEKKIWVSSKPESYEELNISVIPADSEEYLLHWRILREFIHTAVWHTSPGRMGRYIVAHTEERKHPFGGTHKIYKYLGLISIASDFISVGGRDEYIGWNRKDKLEGMLKHTAMGSSIVPVQPFGYNYLGGKLISLMVCSDAVENHWNSRYKENLAGITTTSLYGGFSQYNGLKYWRKCKSTEGKVKIEPSENVYEELRKWVKVNHPEKYPYNPANSRVSHPKQRILSFASKELDVKIPESTFKRGVYWCGLYKNTNEFLRREHNELKEKRFDNSVKSLTDLWKEKYAKKRIHNLTVNDRISDELLFYSDLVGMSWKETREKYIHDVGR